MIHFDFAYGPKMAIAAPTPDEAEELFAFFREETDVKWAGREALTDTLWSFIREKTVYHIGTHHSGLQVGEVEYALKSGYKIYSVDQFIAEHRTEEDDGETPDLSGLL